MPAEASRSAHSAPRAVGGTRPRRRPSRPGTAATPSMSCSADGTSSARPTSWVVPLPLLGWIGKKRTPDVSLLLPSPPAGGGIPCLSCMPLIKRDDRGFWKNACSHQGHPVGGVPAGKDPARDGLLERVHQHQAPGRQVLQVLGLERHHRAVHLPTGGWVADTPLVMLPVRAEAMSPGQLVRGTMPMHVDRE
jgi:hypothetical protein